MRREGHKTGHVIATCRSIPDHTHTFSMSPVASTACNFGLSKKLTDYPKGLKGGSKHTYMLLPTVNGFTNNSYHPNLINRKRKVVNRVDFSKNCFAWKDFYGYEATPSCDDNVCVRSKIALNIPDADLDVSRTKEVTEDSESSQDVEGGMYSIEDVPPTRLESQEDTTVEDEQFVSDHATKTSSGDSIKNVEYAGDDMPACLHSADDIVEEEEATSKSYLTEFPPLGSSPTESTFSEDFYVVGSYDRWCLL